MASLTCEVETMLAVQNVDLEERARGKMYSICEEPCDLELLLIHEVNEKWQMNSRPSHEGEINMKLDMGGKPLA